MITWLTLYMTWRIEIENKPMKKKKKEDDAGKSSLFFKTAQSQNCQNRKKDNKHKSGYIEVSHQIPQLEVEERSDDEVKSDQISMYSDTADWPISVPDKLRMDLIQRRSEPLK